MSPFRCTLVAADFSERSKEAFRVACSLANETKARVFALHVVEPVPGASYPFAFGDAGAFPPLNDGDGPPDPVLIARLRGAYTPNRPIDVAYLVAHGPADETILRAAGRLGADLIALGTHGRTGLARLLMGSVAEAVLRRARCPVLALRSAEPGLDLEWGVRAVLHATDLSEDSRAALTVARSLARDLGARLVLFHVLPVANEVPGVVPLPLDVPATREALGVLRRRCDGPDLKAPVETALRQGRYAEEILRAADEARCDLIVTGTHGRSGLGRVLMGSVAEAVLRRARCPVIAVKQGCPAVVAPAGAPEPALAR
jgi:nucleotide-binding universal stress UspA family protein